MEYWSTRYRVSPPSLDFEFYFGWAYGKPCGSGWIEHWDARPGFVLHCLPSTIWPTTHCDQTSKIFPLDGKLGVLVSDPTKKFSFSTHKSFISHTGELFWLNSVFPHSSSIGDYTKLDITDMFSHICEISHVHLLHNIHNKNILRGKLVISPHPHISNDPEPRHFADS